MKHVIVEKKYLLKLSIEKKNLANFYRELFLKIFFIINILTN